MKGYEEKQSVKDVALLIMRDMDLDSNVKYRDQLPRFVRYVVEGCRQYRLGYFLEHRELNPVPTIELTENGYPVIEKPCNYLFMLEAYVIDKQGNQLKLDYTSSKKSELLIVPANHKDTDGFGLLPVIKEEDDAFLFSTDATGYKFYLVYAAVSADDEGYPYVDGACLPGLTAYCRYRMAIATGTPNEARGHRLTAAQEFRQVWGRRVGDLVGTDFMRAEIAKHNNPWAANRNQYAVAQNNSNSRVLSGKSPYYYNTPGIYRY